MHTKYVDVLSTLALKVDVPDNTVDMRIMKSTLQATATHLIPVDFLMSKLHYTKFASTILDSGSKLFESAIQDKLYH